jgi:hypothetical protein
MGLIYLAELIVWKWDFGDISAPYVYSYVAGNNTDEWQDKSYRV